MDTIRARGNGNTPCVLKACQIRLSRIYEGFVDQQRFPSLLFESTAGAEALTY